MQAVLSIITVTRNCISTIGDTLKSVQSIKNPTIEYIVIDGASVDGTLELIIRENSLVDILVSESDTGIYNAMNKGIDRASGKYILFMNGDDQIAPKEFNEIVSRLREGDSDIYCAQTLVPGNHGLDELLVANKWLLPFFNAVPHPSSFVRSDVLRRFRFREDLRIASDYDLFLRLFIARKSFQKIDVISAIHYRGGASGNLMQSSIEVNRIRKERLGIVFYLTEFLLSINRLVRKFWYEIKKAPK